MRYGTIKTNMEDQVITNDMGENFFEGFKKLPIEIKLMIANQVTYD